MRVLFVGFSFAFAFVRCRRRETFINDEKVIRAIEFPPYMNTN